MDRKRGRDELLVPGADERALKRHRRRDIKRRIRDVELFGRARPTKRSRFMLHGKRPRDSRLTGPSPKRARRDTDVSTAVSHEQDDLAERLQNYMYWQRVNATLVPERRRRRANASMPQTSDAIGHLQSPLQ